MSKLVTACRIRCGNVYRVWPAARESEGGGWGKEGLRTGVLAAACGRVSAVVEHAVTTSGRWLSSQLAPATAEAVSRMKQLVTLSPAARNGGDCSLLYCLLLCVAQ